jgi:ribonuclease HII
MLSLKYSDFELEAGIDEAGRGCLAGPVVAAAVILPLDFHNEKLNDSKKLTHKDRLILREIILKEAICWEIGIIDAPRIDEINILQATFEAMHRAIDGLSLKPAFLAIDGNRFRPHAIPSATIIKGDGKFANIAAASILAKTFRDDIMEELHAEYNMYLWNENKGYPTLAHKDAIALHGLTKYHRKTFRWQKTITLFDNEE